MTNVAAFLYLVSGVLFILALRGLSHPATSRKGNLYGMIGMGIAILTTLVLATPSFSGFVLIVLGLAIGGGAGAYIARVIPMTSMPQLVAGFHSLVGLAAVLVAASALYTPDSFGIGNIGSIHAEARIEMALGRRDRRAHLYRLDHRLPEARRPHVGQAHPSALPAHHQHRAVGVDCALHRRPRRNRKPFRFLGGRGAFAGARRAADHTDRRRRHAGRRLDAELLFWMGCRRHRFHAR